MSNVSSVLTCTSVYTDFEPWRYYGEDSAETRPPRIIVYGYDRLFMHPIAPPSPDYVSLPEHPPSPDYVPGLEHPSLLVEIPYVPKLEYPKLYGRLDSDPEEDLKDDQAKYPADGRDGDDEPFDDDDDDDDTDSDPDEDLKEEPFEKEEDDDEEEEHLALADSFVVPIVDPVLPARDTEALEADEPTPIPISPIIISLSQTRLRRVRKTIRPEPPMSASMKACIAKHAALLSPPPPADMPPRKRDCLTTTALGFEVEESSATGAARSSAIAAHVRILEVHVAALIAQTSSLQTQLTTALRRIKILEARDPEPQEGPAKAGISWTFVYLLAIIKMAPKRRTTRATPATITTPTTTITNTQLQALIDRGIAAALAERDADRSRNGDNNNDSGMGGRRQMNTLRECTYTDFLKCQPMSFQGTKGVIGLTRCALTWWNSHMRAVGQDVAYAMPWSALKRMITDKYRPKGDIQKLESESWNLKVKESAKVDRYISSLPDMIHGSVKASKPQSMQEAIEFATEMM
nr:hypothetical protein [Tanacetum cinerariifolium]